MAVRNIEREIEALKELCASQSAESCIRALKKALGDKINVIVARAAALVAKTQHNELVPDLSKAFDRMMINPVKSDPKCWAKEAIAKALKDLGHAESELFLKGVKHVQLEATWGGHEDTASTLRSTCALAIMQCTDLTREDKLWAVMPLLTEASPSSRKDGALALESLEGREAALLLRIKARMGDEDTTVSGQVFESLLHVEKDSAVSFVAEFLRYPNIELQQEAVLALGASRLPAAVAVLKETCEKGRAFLDSEILFRALSISRNEDALEFLNGVVKDGRLREAMAALDALKIYRESSDVREKIARAVSNRQEPEIQREFQKLFAET